jgi:prepilin-type processing-associated H-X9-DG protein
MLMWPAAISPYVKNRDLFRCPSQDRGKCCGSSHGMNAFPAISYAMNEPISCGPFGCCNKWHKLKELGYPAETLLMGDGRNNLGGWDDNNLHLLARFATPDPGYCVGCGGTYAADALDRYSAHNGGSNIGFADGHVKWFAAQNIRTVEWGGSIRYRTWQLR